MIIRPAEDPIERPNDRTVYEVICFTTFDRPDDLVDCYKFEEPTQRRPQDNEPIERPNDSYPDIKRIGDNPMVNRPQDNDPVWRE